MAVTMTGLAVMTGVAVITGMVAVMTGLAVMTGEAAMTGLLPAPRTILGKRRIVMAMVRMCLRHLLALGHWLLGERSTTVLALL